MSMEENNENDLSERDKKLEKFVIAFCILTCFGFFIKIVFF